MTPFPAPALNLLAIALAVALAQGPASAQDVRDADVKSYPNRTVRIIVPFPPGGPADLIARFVGQKLSEDWGQPVVIENRAGGNTTIGAVAAARSAPDGYTLLVTYAGSQAINPALYPKIPFDSVKDFTLVATLASTPFILIVNPNLPAKSLAEYIALARAKPDALTYASSGNGSVNHLLGEMVKREAGIKMLHVPYRGVAPAITDVIGGQVDSAFSSVPSVLQMIQTDKVRALAVSSGKRIAAAPDIPTIAEQGFPGFDVNPWWGILAPAGLDAAIVRKISEDVATILRTKEMIDFLAAQGAEPLIMSPDDFLKVLQADIVKWDRVVKGAGVTLN